MLALRSISRALPRAAFRASPIPFRATQRYIAIPRPTILSRTTPYKAFSTTRSWREAAGDEDAQLAAKFDHERQLELEDRPDHVTVPQELESFLSQSPFKIQDTPGTENIIMTRQFGNETIKVECSIADMNAQQDEGEFDEDTALDDEPDFEDITSGGKRTINQTKGGKIDIAPEDSIAPADRDVADEPQDLQSFPLNLSITIDKGAAGATNILAQAQDGNIEIDYVHFYPSADMIDATSKEGRDVYGGPPFQYLDTELQNMYETYIQERGIDTNLAYFLTKYVDYKEQREYLQWLQNMKSFIEH